MSQCPYCQRTDEQVKAGRNASGSQRYRCQVCRRKYTPAPNPRGYEESVRRQALQLYVDGLGFRRIGRILGVAHRTVINWVNAHAAQLPDAPPVPDAPSEVNELDELFTFVGDKKKKSTSSPR
jgi:transposase